MLKNHYLVEVKYRLTNKNMQLISTFYVESSTPTEAQIIVENWISQYPEYLSHYIDNSASVIPISSNKYYKEKVDSQKYNTHRKIFL